MGLVGTIIRKPLKISEGDGTPTLFPHGIIFDNGTLTATGDQVTHSIAAFGDPRYVLVAGDTMTGDLTLPNLIVNAGGDIRPSVDSTISIAQADGTDWVYFNTSNKVLSVGGVAVGGNPFQVTRDGSVFAVAKIYKYAGASTITGGIIASYTARGSLASPTAVQTDDIINNIGANGYGATGWSVGAKAGLTFYAAENWTDAAQGTYVTFDTTPIGSTTQAERLRIKDNGDITMCNAVNGADTLGIGTENPLVGQLNIVRSGGGGQRGLYIDQYSSNSAVPLFVFRKAQGTEASPLDIGVGQFTFSQFGAGYINGGFQFTTCVGGVAEGVASPNVYGALVFSTTRDGLTSVISDEKMRLDSLGDLRLYSATARNTFYMVDGQTAAAGMQINKSTVPLWNMNKISGSDDFNIYNYTTSVRAIRIYAADDLVEINGNVLLTTTEKLTFRDSAIGIYSQTDSFMDVFADGGVRIGDSSAGAPTNYSKFESDGTLEFNGTATVWDDMQFQVSDAKVTPASLLPSWEAFTTNTSEYAFSVNDEVDTSANEIPHSWKQGTAGHAHMHITTKAVPAQEEKAQFTVTFAYADTNEVWVEAPLTAELTIPISTTALTSFYLDLGDITLTNYLIEAQMRCRIKRVAKSAGGTEYVGDIFITQVGVHLEMDTVGSRAENAK